MSFATVTRRGFLKGACMLSGGILLGIRMTGKAAAAVKAFKEYMGDRINGVYGADKQFSKRASQDNAQVRTLYESYLASRSATNRKNCCIPNGLTNPARSRN